jgi:hypothetical protein
VGSPTSYFTCQNWLIVPATPLLPSSEIHNQSWLLTLSGVFIHEVAATRILLGGWRTTMNPILIAPDILSPLNFALNLYGIPNPSPGSRPLFNLDPISAPVLNLDPISAPYVNVTGVYDASGVGAGLGFKLGSWEINTDLWGADVLGIPADRVFNSVGVTILRQNLDSINRIAYSFALRGKIVFFQVGPP